ncbi:MAG: ATP-binding cassette domain-containing protein, partial [Spirochaetales bacterium]|nr:ATP-binding cassette domain-containing protein [Spirochaetales bacterium]
MADTLIDIQNISFSYFEDEYEDERETTVKTTETKVFDNISLQIPSGVTSLIGQNGTGKSTLMLLSAGILQPDSGKIFLAGHNTADIADEEKRQHLVSFVYQNMEFETEEDIGTLLKFVYQNGFHKDKNDGLLDELIEVCQLQDVLSRPLQNVSKGESQRVIVAFSLLYGTPIVMMDEPVFACEDYQKHKIFAYLRKYAQKYGVSILFSA